MNTDYNKISEELKKIVNYGKSTPVKPIIKQPKAKVVVKKDTLGSLVAKYKDTIEFTPEEWQDTPKKLAEKLNTLEKEIDYKVLKNIPKDENIVDAKKIIEEIKKNKSLEMKDIKGMPLDQRWHGAGMSSVTTDATLTGNGTAASPLSVVTTVDGVQSINADVTQVQTLSTGTTGTDFAIVDNGTGDHKFNLPTASATNRGALSSANWSTFNAKEPAISTGGPNTVWHGDKTFSTVVEADITLSNNTTNNATVAKHGFLPILSGNSLQFLDGNGNYSTPTAGIANSYSLTTFSGKTTVTVTHNFGTYPNVQVLDSNKAVIIPLSITNNTLNDFTVTFAVSTTGSIIATVGSPQPQALVVITGNYTILNTDRIIKSTSPAITATLPTSVGNTGREFIISNASNGAITLDGDGTETINGQLTQTIPQQSALTVYSDGAGWWII